MSDELFEHSIRMLDAARAQPLRPCKICGMEARPFDVVDLQKSCVPALYPSGLSMVPVLYRMCTNCQFVFTDFFDEFTPQQWQQHIYNAEYVDVDPEYIEIRPTQNAHMLAAFLSGRQADTVGLDFGGGNGRTAALMREYGWRFDSRDPFGHSELAPERMGRYNFCSAIEVFEHSPDPVSSLREIISACSSEELIIYLQTSVHDGVVSEATRLSWWYVGPRNGHISIFSRKSLRILADKFGLAYAAARESSGTPHLLLRGIPPARGRYLLLRSKVIQRWRTLRRRELDR